MREVTPRPGLSGAIAPGRVVVPVTPGEENEVGTNKRLIVN